MAVDPRFFNLLGPASLADLAEVSASVCQGDAGRLVNSVAAAASAGPDDICYYDGKKPPAEGVMSSRAGACFISQANAASLPEGVVAMVTDFPRLAHSRAAGHLLAIRDWLDDSEPHHATNVHSTAKIAPGAYIGPGAAIGDRTVVGPNAVIGAGVQIGRDCVIGANVSIQCALIGNRVKIYSGARLGEAGFGVMPGPQGAEDAPQYGRVILQDGVTVGANSCIDRGAFDDTIIGENTKIDNLCQIAHNVVVGRNVLMASFSGVSGTVTLGDGVQLGGRAGIADHVNIGEGTQIAAASGVFRDIPGGETWAGIPARPIRQWMREIAWLQKQISGDRRKT